MSRKVVLQRRKSERDNVESYYGYRWICTCLIEAQCISALEKEAAQKRVFGSKHRESQPSSAKLLLPIIPIGIVACALRCCGTAFVETTVYAFTKINLLSVTQLFFNLISFCFPFYWAVVRLESEVVFGEPKCRD